MKDLKAILPDTLSKVATGDKFAVTRSSDITVEQRGAIKYFYERLSRIYGSKYQMALPDESTERASKGEFGGRIMNIKREVMDKGFEAIHDIRGKVGNAYEFMDLDLIIELVRNGGNIDGAPAGMYKTFPKLLPEGDTVRHKRKTAGTAELDKLKGMFE